MHADSPTFRGVFSVVPTPFTADGEVDVESLRRVVDHYVDAGVQGLTTLGVTSEVARLTDEERRVVTETVIETADERVPVVVGSSAQSLAVCVAYTEAAVELGASAVMVCPPRLSKLNSETVVQHYRGLADAVPVPIVLQDFPPVQGFTMEPSLLRRIAGEVPKVMAIKLEDAPTPPKVDRILEGLDGEGPSVLGGLGGVYLLEELMAGAAGTMTGFAVPEILAEVVRRFRAGDLEGASDVFYRYVPLMRFEFQQGIGVALRKEVLRRRGVLERADVRAPGPSADDTTLRALENLWSWLAEHREEPWISA